MQTQHPIHSHKPERFATPAVMAGLIVIWMALVIVFKANQWSTTGVQLGKSVAPAAGIKSTEPRLRLLTPATVKLPNLSQRESIELLAKEIDLHVDGANLARLANDKPVDRNFSADTVMMIMHRLIGSDAVGLAVTGERLRLIDQKVQAPAPGVWLWSARIEMDQPEQSIAPLADAPLWFTLRLDGDASQTLAQRRMMFLEVWNGKQLIGAAPAKIDARDQARFAVTGTEQVNMSLHRLPNPTGSAIPCFDMNLEYRTENQQGQQDRKGN